MEAAPGLEALMIPLQADDLEKAVLMEAEAPAPALQPAGHSGLDEEEDDERFQDEQDGLEQHTLLWLLLPRRRVVGWLTAAPAFYICHVASIVGAAGWLGVLDGFAPSLVVLQALLLPLLLKQVLLSDVRVLLRLSWTFEGLFVFANILAMAAALWVMLPTAHGRVFSCMAGLAACSCGLLLESAIIEPAEVVPSALTGLALGVFVVACTWFQRFGEGADYEASLFGGLSTAASCVINRSLTVSLYLAKNLVVHYRNADLFTSLFHPMFKAEVERRDSNTSWHALGLFLNPRPKQGGRGRGHSNQAGRGRRGRSSSSDSRASSSMSEMPAAGYIKPGPLLRSYLGAHRPVGGRNGRVHSSQASKSGMESPTASSPVHQARPPPPPEKDAEPPPSRPSAVTICHVVSTTTAEGGRGVVTSIGRLATSPRAKPAAPTSPTAVAGLDSGGRAAQLNRTLSLDRVAELAERLKRRGRRYMLLNLLVKPGVVRELLHGLCEDTSVAAFVVFCAGCGLACCVLLLTGLLPPDYSAASLLLLPLFLQHVAALDVRVLLLLVQSFEFCFVLGNYFFAIWAMLVLCKREEALVVAMTGTTLLPCLLVDAEVMSSGRAIINGSVGAVLGFLLLVWKEYLPESVQQRPMLWGLTTAGRCFGNRTFLVLIFFVKFLFALACGRDRFVVLRHRMYRYEVHTLPSRLGRLICLPLSGITWPASGLRVVIGAATPSPLEVLPPSPSASSTSASLARQGSHNPVSPLLAAPA